MWFNALLGCPWLFEIPYGWLIVVAGVVVLVVVMGVGVVVVMGVAVKEEVVEEVEEVEEVKEVNDDSRHMQMNQCALFIVKCRLWSIVSGASLFYTISNRAVHCLCSARLGWIDTLTCIFLSSL